MDTLPQYFSGELPELTDAEWAFLEGIDDSGFKELFFGAFGWDRFEAEVALLDKLAVITRNNIFQMDRVFRNSTLHDQRWNSKDGISAPTHGESAIAAAVLRNPIPVIEGILSEGEICILTGYYNSGKTPAIQDLAFHVRNGRRWVGRETASREVLLLDFETPGIRFRANMDRLADRYQSERQFPEAFLLHAVGGQQQVPHGGRWHDHLRFLDERLRQCPDALIVIDPLEVFFFLRRGQSTNVIALFSKLRALLTKWPQASMILVMNIARRRRRAPSLLTDPLRWLEGNAGSLDILNRCDVRLGFEFHDDPSLRVLHGVRRGEDGFQPLLLRPLSSSAGLCGYEGVPLEPTLLELRFPIRRRAYWRLLPREFRFEEVVTQGIVPRSSLSRLIKAARHMGLLVSEEGVHRKV